MDWIHSKRDPTTGLSTLVALFGSLEKHLNPPPSEANPLSLLHLDLDHLSRLNHSLGASAGDEMLHQLVECMAEVIEEGEPDGGARNCIFRLGGDEFAVLLMTGLEEATGIADRIRERFQRKAILDGTHFGTVSIGVAGVPDSAHDLGSLVTAADMGVLEAKRAGGNTVYVRRKDPAEGAENDVAGGIINMLARRMVETGHLLEEAQRYAYSDPITGLPNHRALNLFLEREHHRAVRYRHPYSILMVDGDSLKQFNDSMGHEAGNEWLRRLAHLLTRQTRSTDLVARWFGGDEFVVVMTETDAVCARITAERIREEIEREGRMMPVSATVSIGLVAFPDDGGTPGELLERADAANTEAKRQGKNRVIAYESLKSGEATA